MRLFPEAKGNRMALNVDILMISAIEGENLEYEELKTDGISWKSPPPDILLPFEYHRCECSGPSSGYEIGLKYNGIICRIEVTSWGVSYRKSTPTQHDLELVLVKNKPPYRLEMILI